MAACKSLRHVFDTTIPENKPSSSLIESLSSFNHIKAFRPLLDHHHHHSFTEIFGELHFKENLPNSTSTSIFPSSSTSPSLTSSTPAPAPAFPNVKITQSCNNENHEDEKSSGGAITSYLSQGYARPYHKRSESFTSLNSDSLQFCTEGLGSESLDDAEDLKMEVQKNECTSTSTSSSIIEDDNKLHVRRHSSGDSYMKKKKTDGKTMFPPPISYIGKAGKPTVSFQSYRNDGRFVLKEVRIPTQECLRAKRKDGWLRLSFAQPDDDDDDDDDDEVEKDDDVDDDEDEDDDGGGKEEEEGEEGKIKGDIE